MEILYWWLFSLPIFFGLGWIAARIDFREVLREAKSLPRAFAQSYRHLTSAEPEKAIAPFSGFQFPSNASFELVISLGVLYRRQGHFLEAIRLHEELHQRVDLDDNELDEVTWELANDYLKAGMLDRAIMCAQALKAPAMQERATLTMLEIFQIEKQWDKALEYSAKAVKENADNPSPSLGSRSLEVSHYHCELALRAFQRLDVNTATHHINAALKEQPRSVRVAMLQADFAFTNKEYVKAIDFWKKAVDLEPQFLIQAVGKIHSAYSEIENSQEEEFRLLTNYFEDYPSGALLYEIVKVLGGGENKLPADKLFSWLRKYESSLQSWQTIHIAIQTLLEDRKLSANKLISDNKSLLLQMLSVLRPQHFGYVCDSCGFLLPNFVWRCPGCGEWESYSPIPRASA